MRLLLLVVFTALSWSSAQAEIYRLTAKQIRDVSFEGVLSTSCRSAADGKLWSLRISTEPGVFTQDACSDSRHTAAMIDLNRKARDLVVDETDTGRSCVLSEICHGRDCRREYGTLHITRHELVLFTKQGTLEIQDYQEVLQTECQR